MESKLMRQGLKKLREFSVPLLIFAGFSFTLGFFYRYELPKIKSWALIEIEELSKKHLPIRVWPQKIELNLFPLGIELQDIRLLPQGKLKEQMGETRLDRFGVTLSLYSLFTGRPRLDDLYIEGGVIRYIFPTEPNQVQPGRKKQHLSSKEFIELKLEKMRKQLSSFKFNEVYSLPINRLVMRKINFYMQWSQYGNSVQVKGLNLKVGNAYKALTVDIDLPLLRIKETGAQEILDFSVDSHFLLEDKELKLKSVNFKHKKSIISLSGLLRGNITRLDIEKTKLKVTSHIDLAEFRRGVTSYNRLLTVPEVLGELNIEMLIDHAKGQMDKMSFALTSTNVFVAGFEVGDLTARGSLDKNKVQFSKLILKNSAGKVRMDPASVSMMQLPNKQKTVKFKAQVDVQQLALKRLLKGLKVGDVPLTLGLNGKLPCWGELQPNFDMSCKGKIFATGLSVWAPGAAENFPILDIAKAEVAGQVNINARQVTYAGDIRLPNSKGSSEGVINFDEGFKIKYSAAQIDFSDIENLANLNIQGLVGLEGSTQGTSGYGTIGMNVKAKNMWLDDFYLGAPRFGLNYKSGKLKFRKIAGKLGATRYNGKLSIDVYKKQIHLAAKIPYFELNEVKLALKRRLPLAWEVGGTGTASIKLHGPLDIKELSYEVRSTVYRGKLMDEPFDQFDIHLVSKAGNVESKIFEVAKADGLIRLQGRVTKSGHLDAVVVGRKLRFEQSENFKKWGLRLAGYLDFTMSMKGPFLGPTVEVFGRGTSLKVGDDYMQDSIFKLNASPESVVGTGQFFGKLVELDFKIPIEKSQPLFFQLKTQDWDFTPVFHIFSSAVAKNEFSASLTSNLLFKSASGSLKDLKGDFVVKKFQLKRDNKFLKNNNIMTLKYDKNKFLTKNFALTGSDGFLKLSHTKEKASQINLALEGKIDLALATLLTPFLEDLSGSLSLSVNLGGRFDSPKMYGSAYLQDTQVRLKAFPMPLEEISADILFSDQKIFINAVQGELGGGPFTGSGVITLGGLFNIPMDIKVQFRDSTFNVPQGFKTVGQGNVALSGSHFPYLLKGSYSILSGRVKKDLNQKKTDGPKITLSKYLPEFLLAKSFQPLILDIAVDIGTPLPVDLSVDPIRIETPVTGKLNIKGLPDDLKLTGLISAGENGRVTFRDNVFDIRNAKVEYLNKPPESPELNVAAESRIQEYDIGLLVRGSPIDPKISLVSQPPLKESEIISLLVLGFTSSDTSGDGESEDYDPSSGKLFEAINSQLGISKQVKDLTGIDLQISSSYDSSENSNIQKFRVKKQITNRLGVSAGHAIGVTQKNDLKVEYKLIKGLSVIGLYEREESTGATTSTEESERESEIYGLDLEYRFEFR